MIKFKNWISGEDEFSKYISSADPLILRLRVEMLMQENCEEWALNLCTCCLRQRRYQTDLEFKTMELLLLFKLGNMEKIQEVVSACSPSLMLRCNSEALSVHISCRISFLSWSSTELLLKYIKGQFCRNIRFNYFKEQSNIYYMKYSSYIKESHMTIACMEKT